MNKRVIIILSLIILFVIPSLQAQRFNEPADLYYFQPAASVFGCEAIWTNPAGLSTSHTSGYQIIADYSDNKFAKSWASTFHRDALGIAYRKIYIPGSDDEIKHYTFAGAIKTGPNMHIGLSYQYYKDNSAQFSKAHLWSIGILGQVNPHYRYGVVFSNLNNATIDNFKTETEMRYSLAYRPYGKVLTISADMLLTTKTKFRNADFVYHAEVNPSPGILLNAYIDSHKNFEFGFRINFLRTFLGNRNDYTKSGDHRRSTVFIGATDRQQESVIPQKPKKLSATLRGPVDENPVNPVFGKKKVSFITNLLDLYKAASDPSISGLNLHLDRISLGFAQAQELRNAILSIKKQNKPVTCYISYPSNISYYIASAADKIVIPPVSQLNLVGLRTELTFYGAALDKLGVNVDLIRIGDYKTAAETFTEEESSEANKKQMNRILDNLYDQFVTDIADGRNLSADSVRKIIDNGPFTSVDAYKFGLVDSLAYLDEYAKMLHKNEKQISLTRYHNDSLFTNSWEKKPLIAILVTEGEVQPDNYSSFYSRGRSITPRKVQSSLHQLYKSKPDAVILRINSPGGFAMAGEEIYHSLDVYAKHKKLYVSMGNMTASGGYYYAMSGQKIFASPATITGSIGIFGGKADFKQLYEKLHINKELFQRGKYSAMLSNINPFSDQEREKYYYHLKSMYDHFVSLVAENREMPADSIDNLGQGRVWTGSEAQQNGLIDQVGGLKETIEAITADLDLNDYDIEIYPQIRPLFVLPGKTLFSPFVKLLTSDKTQDELIESIAPVESAEFYTRLPFDITIQ